MTTEMQLRIVRRIPLTEVTDRVKQYERQFGANLDEVSNQFEDRVLDQEAFDDYVEWMAMEHALGAYVEGEAFDFLTEDILNLGSQDLSKLTPKRLELLDQMSRHNAKSINELASSIGRDVKNVYNDLKTLESLGLIELMRDGRRLIPDLLVKEISFLTW
jgi:DNA-binding transcriptional ArsR family regulator